MKKIFIVFAGLIFSFGLWAQSLPEKFEIVEGFTIKGEKQFFDRNNLYDYINGASDFYLGYDFQDLWVVDYENDQQQNATLELYRMGNERYAFGIYSEERPQEAEVKSIGAEGFADGGAVFFLAGVYYVKVYNGSPAMPDYELSDFASMIAGKICDECHLPQQISYFPKDGKVPSSERYMAENFMGVTGFNGAFTAQYTVGDQSCRLYVYKGDDDYCRTLLEKYFGRVKYKKKLKEKAYLFDDPYLGKVKISYKKGFIIGLLDATDPAHFNSLYTKFEMAVK